MFRTNVRVKGAIPRWVVSPLQGVPWSVYEHVAPPEMAECLKYTLVDLASALALEQPTEEHEQEIVLSFSLHIQRSLLGLERLRCYVHRPEHGIPARWSG